MTIIPTVLIASTKPATLGSFQWLWYNIDNFMLERENDFEVYLIVGKGTKNIERDLGLLIF